MLMMSPGSTTASGRVTPNSISPAGLPLFRDTSAISEPIAAAPPPLQQLRRESTGQSEERSSVSGADTSDAVLLRCRHTIERLHEEAEAERQRCVELQRQVAALEAELQAANARLEHEQAQRLETEALSLRLERRAAEAEARLGAAQRDREEASHLRAASAANEELRRELEGVQESQRRQAQEAQQLAAECRQLLERLADREAENARLQQQVEQLARGAGSEREERRRLQEEAGRWEESCGRLESQAQLGVARAQESLKRDLTVANAELSECRVERDQGRSELRRSGQQLEQAKAELDCFQRELADARLEARSEARSVGLRSELQTAERELERGRAALAREEEKARQMQTALRCSEDEARRRCDDASALADMLSQTQRHVAELEIGRREAEKTTVEASLRAREAEAELRSSSNLEGKVERLRQKYRQNMAKMYRHLSEREAYEQRLKDYIEGEVGVLRMYSREMEDYWRSRCGRRRTAESRFREAADEEDEGEEEAHWQLRRPRRPASTGRTPRGFGLPPPWPAFGAEAEMLDEADWERRASASEWERPF